MLKRHLSIFVLLNFAAFSIPAYLTGCGANPSTSATAMTSGSGGGDGGTTGSGSGSGGSGSGSGRSGSGGSGSGSGSGSSGSGSSGSSSSGSSSPVPAGALAVNDIQKLSNWSESFDLVSGNNNASGETSITSSPSRSGADREFVSTYTNFGSERYSVIFGDDSASTNFFYDGWIYIASPASDIANLELDVNQVLSDGQTVIYGFQCDGNSGTWDYTKNSGTPEKFNDVWLHSNAPCSPRNWSTNTWHHVQIEYSRDDSGNVTYKAVWLDGTEHDLNATVPSKFDLGWSTSNLVTNFQVDGAGARGKSTVYLDDLTIYRW
jgi:hypothetical protein